MRHLGEVAEGRHAGAGDLELERGDECRRHAEDPGRPGRDVRAQQARRRFGAEDRDGPGVWHGRRDRPEADPLGDAQPARQVDDRPDELAPAVVGFGADEDQQVVVAHPRPAEDELGPGQLGQATVHDLERRPAGAIVEHLVRIERRDDRGFADELLERRRGGRPGVDPSVERRDQRRGDEVARVVEVVDAHARRIGRDAGGQPARQRTSPLGTMNQPSGRVAQSPPRLGDGARPSARRRGPARERLLRERGVEDAVRPQAAPPGAVLGGREAPRRSPTG